MPFTPLIKGLALVRCNNRCERCQRALVTGRYEFHHRHAESLGGSDSLSNCEVLCKPCHQNTASYGRPKRLVRRKRPAA